MMARRPEAKDLTIIVGTGNWSAIYDQGELVDADDHDVIAEKVYQLLGIEVLYSSIPLSQPRTTATPRGVCLTLADAKAAISEAVKRRSEAEDLREEASRLLAQAEKLERMTTFTSLELARIGEILAGLQALDPDDADNPSGVYFDGPITIRSHRHDDEIVGSFISQDGFWEFQSARQRSRLEFEGPYLLNDMQSVVSDGFNTKILAVKELRTRYTQAGLQMPRLHDTFRAFDKVMEKKS